MVNESLSEKLSKSPPFRKHFNILTPFPNKTKKNAGNATMLTTKYGIISEVLKLF